METYRALRVLRADRGGSSWPVLIDTDGGVFHTKLRGAAQAPASLVAELIVGALADALGLSVPARVLIDIPARRVGGRSTPGAWGSASAEHRSESGVPVHAGCAELPADGCSPCWSGAGVEDRVARRPGAVIRTALTKNPNLLWSHGALLLIDHGASLGFQHDWPRVTEQSPRSRGWQVGSHVLRSRATELQVVDAALAARLHRSELESALDAVPDDFVAEDGPEATRRRRAAFVAFLWKRLQGPRPFLPATQPAAG